MNALEVGIWVVIGCDRKLLCDVDVTLRNVHCKTKYTIILQGESANCFAFTDRINQADDKFLCCLCSESPVEYFIPQGIAMFWE